MTFSFYLWTFGFSFVVLNILLSVYNKWKKNRRDSYRNLDKIPGPPGIPIFGNALEITANIKNIINLFQVEWIKKYGDFYRTKVGSLHSLCLANPDYIEVILKSTTQITKGATYDPLREWIGDGLINSTGSKWKAHRRLLTPAFHFKILESFFDIFNEQSRILADCMDQERRIYPESELDVFPLVTRCTLDIICEAAMGVPIHAQTNYDSTYVKAVKKEAHYVLKRSFQPLIASDFIFNLTPWGWDHRRCIKVIHDFANKVIHEKKDQLQKAAMNTSKNNEDDESFHSKKKKAFLDLILTADEDGYRLTEKEVREEVDTFMFAGHDTNSAALTWFLYFMAKNPVEQEKVYEELKNVFGDSDRYCTPEDARELKYLECCIKETLRMLPPAANYRRLVTEDIQIGDFTIPAGWNVVVFVYAVHHNPKYYPEPEVFTPERFLPGNSVGRHPFAFIPFSAGPRNCIGQKCAILEEKVVLSTLLRKFQFKLSPRTKLEPRQEVILRPSDKMILQVIPRT